jgi:hypothetical protein
MEAPWLRLPAECQEPTCIAVERCPRESWPAIEPHAAADHRRSGQAGAARWPPRGHLLLRLGEREEVRREDRNIRKALQPCEKDMKSIPLYKNRKGNTTPGSAPRFCRQNHYTHAPTGGSHHPFSPSDQPHWRASSIFPSPGIDAKFRGVREGMEERRHPRGPTRPNASRPPSEVDLRRPRGRSSSRWTRAAPAAARPAVGHGCAPARPRSPRRRRSRGRFRSSRRRRARAAGRRGGGGAGGDGCWGEAGAGGVPVVGAHKLQLGSAVLCSGTACRRRRSRGGGEARRRAGVQRTGSSEIRTPRSFHLLALACSAAAASCELRRRAARSGA